MNTEIIEYRTLEQFEQIMDSKYNGNHMEAARYCVKYSFYAIDIIEMWNEYGESYGWFNPLAFITIIETATQLDNMDLS